MADFWNVIELARKGGGPSTPSTSPEALKKVLSGLSTEDVQNFMCEFSAKLVELNQWSLWAAGYVIAGGMSDDSFHYFRSWIVGKGQDCFQVALKDPSGLIPFLDNLEVENELLEYVALEVLEGRGVEDDPTSDFDAHPDDEPSGEPFDEDTVAEQFPKLASFATQFEERLDKKSNPSKGGFLKVLWDRLRSRD